MANLSREQIEILDNARNGKTIDLLYGGKFRQGQKYLNSSDVRVLAEQHMIEYQSVRDCVTEGRFKIVVRH